MVGGREPRSREARPTDVTVARTPHQPRPGLRRLGVIVAALAFASGVVACGEEAPDVGTPGGGETSTPSEPTGNGTEDLHIVTTEAGFNFYGPCGNETLEHEGVTYYPPRERELLDTDLSRYVDLVEGVDPGAAAPLGSSTGRASPTAPSAVAAADLAVSTVTVASATAAPAASSPVALAPAIPLVPPPSPGDDVGTLTIFSDGMAHFESESGTTYWLHTDFAGNEWVC